MSFERIINKIFYPLFWKIARDQGDTFLQTQRTQKAVKNLYKLSYYFPITIFGYYVLRDSLVLPP